MTVNYVNRDEGNEPPISMPLIQTPPAMSPPALEPPTDPLFLEVLQTMFQERRAITTTCICMYLLVAYWLYLYFGDGNEGIFTLLAWFLMNIVSERLVFHLMTPLSDSV